jgi:hypothetical protein
VTISTQCEEAMLLAERIQMRCWRGYL